MTRRFPMVSAPGVADPRVQPMQPREIEQPPSLRDQLLPPRDPESGRFTNPKEGHSGQTG